jgi:hypothetical protein
MAEGAKRTEAAARSNRRFNDAVIDRILHQVGDGLCPPTLDREALVAALERVAQSYSMQRYLDDQPSDRKMLQQVERILSTARRLDNLLPTLDGSGSEDPDPLWRLMRTAASDIGDPASAAWQAIEGVRLSVALFHKILQDRSYSLGWNGHPSAESWLIEDALPKIYEQHFGRSFRMSRDKLTGLPSGPGIRFIIEVLSIMGVLTRDGKSYGPEAIEYYLRPHSRAKPGIGESQSEKASIPNSPT